MTKVLIVSNILIFRSFFLQITILRKIVDFLLQERKNYTQFKQFYIVLVLLLAQRSMEQGSATM